VSGRNEKEFISEKKRHIEVGTRLVVGTEYKNITQWEMKKNSHKKKQNETD